MKLLRVFQILPTIFLLSACGQMHASSSLPPTSASPALAASYADVTGADKSDSAADAAPAAAMPSACLAEGLSVEMSFICKLLPVIVKMDLQVSKQRQMVLQLQKQGPLNTDQSSWMASLRSEYGLASSASYAQILERVDVVPIALMISQAALESDWGRSNIARDAGNLFGRHGIIGRNACYMVGSVCLIKYSSLDQMISDQVQYYNTADPAFMQNFRAARARLRAAGKSLDSVVLTESLKGYAAIQAGNPDKYPEQLRATLQGAYHIDELVQGEEDVVEQ